MLLFFTQQLEFSQFIIRVLIYIFLYTLIERQIPEVMAEIIKTQQNNLEIKFQKHNIFYLRDAKTDDPIVLFTGLHHQNSIQIIVVAMKEAIQDSQAFEKNVELIDTLRSWKVDSPNFLPKGTLIKLKTISNLYSHIQSQNYNAISIIDRQMKGENIFQLQLTVPIFGCETRTKKLTMNLINREDLLQFSEGRRTIFLQIFKKFKQINQETISRIKRQKAQKEQNDCKKTKEEQRLQIQKQQRIKSQQLQKIEKQIKQNSFKMSIKGLHDLPMCKNDKLKEIKQDNHQQKGFLKQKNQISLESDKYQGQQIQDGQICFDKKQYFTEEVLLQQNSQFQSGQIVPDHQNNQWNSFLWKVLSVKPSKMSGSPPVQMDTNQVQSLIVLQNQQVETNNNQKNNSQLDQTSHQFISGSQAHGQQETIQYNQEGNVFGQDLEDSSSEQSSSSLQNQSIHNDLLQAQYINKLQTKNQKYLNKICDIQLLYTQANIKLMNYQDNEKFQSKINPVNNTFQIQRKVLGYQKKIKQFVNKQLIVKDIVDDLKFKIEQKLNKKHQKKSKIIQKAHKNNQKSKKIQRNRNVYQIGIGCPINLQQSGCRYQIDQQISEIQPDNFEQTPIQSLEDGKQSVDNDFLIKILQKIKKIEHNLY